MTRYAIAEQDRALLRRVRDAVCEVEPTAQVILHGSRARGAAAPDSDWDLLVLVDGAVDHERTRRLRDHLYDLSLETGEVLSAIVYGRDEWESSPAGALPFQDNVLREGVVL